MRFKPPPADPRKQKEEEQKRLKRAALIPVLIAMAVILGVASYTFLQKESQPTVRRPIAGELALMGGMPGMAMEMMPDMPVGPSFTDEPRPQNATGLMLLHPGDDPFGGEPADLTPFPSSKSLRTSGVVRDAEGIGEQMVFWSFNGAVDDVLKHYKSQAEAAGFNVIAIQKPRQAAVAPATTGPTTQPAAPRSTLGSASTTQVYFRQLPAGSTEGSPDHRGAQCLIVRVTPQDDGSVRTLLWLRYSTPPRQLPSSR